MSGPIYIHLRLNDNTKKTLESSSFLYALIELLEKKGVIDIEELDAQKKKLLKGWWKILWVVVWV